MPLHTSKHAPKTPAESLAISRAEKLTQDKARATRLLARLQWKAQSLEASYLRALGIWQREMQDATHNSNTASDDFPVYRAGLNSRQAESMFKIDFFEFYTLLERYLELCLSIVGVYVHANAPRVNVNALRYITNPEWARTQTQSLHAFHANLLEALDREDCPLHASFADQEVRVQLGFAKDYRNAWKNADAEGGANGRVMYEEERRAKKLPDLDLEKMLMLLLAGCEHACRIVQQQSVPSVQGVMSRDFEAKDEGNVGMTEEMPFEYMDDYMDLD